MKSILKKIIVKILIFESKLILLRYKPKIIAVTGSVGKTSTKDAIFTILSKFKKIRKSEKSFNSDIGIPLTILGCPNGWSNPWIWAENIFKGLFLIFGFNKYPEWLILEVGAGKPGDIKNIAPWLSPDFVVITRFPEKPVHVEFFGSSDNVVEEKKSLALALKKDGLLILNHDDERVYNLRKDLDCKTVSYGFHELATYRGLYQALEYKENGIPDGIVFKLQYDNNIFPVKMPNIIGMHFVWSALSALAVANEIGCDLLKSIEALSEYSTPPGRLNLIKGINNSVIIDDTYNSSPVAMEVALNFLKDVKGKRRIAVLGDMLELGKITKETHNEVGKSIKEIADILVVVGPRAKFIADGAIESGFKKENIRSFDSSVEAGKFLAENSQEGDIIFLKGSQGIRLEHAILPIMADLSQKDTILCRQEKEWEFK
ncbi:MAG: UDP-N-acetylmuramoyl-tripeptide--D-alanyl-D-alanine ligase [Patescibacteria group bacterium]|nr:UDP-N-acetylmuramoyl-tripeptide--D-alanyl-D-alanine ligase [Patescibacteria group bacterium]